MEKLLQAMLGFYVPLALGWLYGKRSKEALAGSKVIAQLLVYLFLPALIFTSLYGKSVGEGLAVPIVASTSVALGALMARLLLKKPEYVLTCMYPNSGYLPIPLAFSLWGKEGVAYVALYVLGNNPTANALAPLLAGRGLREGVRRMLLFPPLHAVALAILLNVTHVIVPAPVLSTVARLGLVAPPLALVLLGMKFAESRVELSSSARVYSVRLGLVMPLAFSLAMLCGLGDLPLKVVLLELLMPPAVSNVALASELGMDSARVASIVVTLTLLSTLIVVPAFLLYAA